MPRLLALAALAALVASAAAQTSYVPPRGAWERRDPRAVALDPLHLDEAIAYAQTHESKAPRALLLVPARGCGREPCGAAGGPFRTRGPQTGVILRHGYLVAEWGEPKRVDPTFGVVESVLSTVAALAVADERIDLGEEVWRSQAPVTVLGDGGPDADPAAFSTLDLFPGAHNRAITWDHLLRQTSAWRGALWGTINRDADAGLDTTRAAPGTDWEASDTRADVLALALLNVWRRPLPAVLRERVMDPIGASPTWRWHGYHNSWVLLDGLAVESVSRGTRGGGGLWISAYDQARFGLLTLRRGRWGDRRVVPDAWFDTALTPTPANPGYGIMNYALNAGRKRFPGAPPSAYAHIGAGPDLIYVDPLHDLVIVARWIDADAIDGLIQRVLSALTE